MNADSLLPKDVLLPCSGSLLRVVLVDDSALLRLSFKTGLLFEGQSQIEVVGEAENGLEALEVVERVKPDAVIMDIGMPGMNGIQATQHLRKTHPQLCIIMLTSHQNEQEVTDAFRAGATSYCLKETTPAEMVGILQRSKAGGTWIDPVIARTMLSVLLAQQPAATAVVPLTTQLLETPFTTHVPQAIGANNTPPCWVHLSERESEVLAQLCQGANNSQVAEALCISMNTVKTHIKNVYAKLGVEDRTSAVVLALKEGFPLSSSSL